jgi:hypothetical protein
MLRLVSSIDCRNGAEHAEYRQDFLPVLTECQAAGNVPRRTAALSHDNNPADQFVSDWSKYMRIAPMAWISIALNRLPRRRRACPGDSSIRHHLGISGPGAESATFFPGRA